MTCKIRWSHTICREEWIKWLHTVLFFWSLWELCTMTNACVIIFQIINRGSQLKVGTLCWILELMCRHEVQLSVVAKWMRTFDNVACVEVIHIAALMFHFGCFVGKGHVTEEFGAVVRIEIVQPAHFHVQLAILCPTSVPLTGWTSHLGILDVVEISKSSKSHFTAISHSEGFAQVAVRRETITTFYIA